MFKFISHQSSGNVVYNYQQNENYFLKTIASVFKISHQNKLRKIWYKLQSQVILHMIKSTYLRLNLI